jgi:hypothetical protein
VILGLLEVDIVQHNLTSKGGAAGARLVSASGEIAQKLRKYMAVRALMSVLMGLAAWAFAALVGMALLTSVLGGATSRARLLTLSAFTGGAWRRRDYRNREERQDDDWACPPLRRDDH